MKAIQVTEFGGPEVLVYREVPDPVVTKDQFLVEVTHVGVNYADTHQAENSYLSQTQLPFIPGSEVVGHDSTGATWLGFTTSGGYAQKAVLDSQSAVPLPEGVSPEAGLACLVQGLTAWHLIKTSARLQAGESMLVHAAAGGVGNLLLQLGRYFKATPIIGTVSSKEKIAELNSLGFNHIIIANPTSLKDEVKALTNGRGADTCYEMVGGELGNVSLTCLAPFGRLVVYGMASRQPMSDVSPASLMYGSRSIVGFWLVDLIVNRPAEMAQSLTQLLDLVKTDQITPIVGPQYRLKDAKQAHEDLRARKTTGKVTLQVGD